MKGQKSNSQPPKCANRFLSWFIKGDLLEEILGDLYEYYQELLVAPNWKRTLYYWFHVFNFLKPFALKRLEGTYKLNYYGMFKNYFKVIGRNLARKKLYAGINILGMALAIAVSMAIYSYVFFEMNFEKHHSKSERMVRFNYRYQNDKGYDTHWARVDGVWVNELPEQFSQIEKMIRFQSFRPRDIIVGENKYKEEQAFAVDKEIFEVFDFDFISGNPQYALRDPFSVVLTASTAKRYFGSEHPVGKDVLIKNERGTKEAYKVTAIIADPPLNTHIPITLLSSINKEEDRKGWAFIYMLLTEGVDIKQFEEDINSAQQEKYPDQAGSKFTLHLQPIEDIHLHSKLSREIVENGDYKSILTFIGVAILLLILAAVNFANLNTVQSLDRSKEAGIRKVMGATASNLGLYFLLEALVLTILSVVVGSVLYIVTLPFLESFIGIELHFDKMLMIQLLLLVILLITVLSGMYPARFLSKNDPIQALKGGANLKFKGGRTQKILIGVQFVISIGLISSTLIVNQQFNFIQNHHLGYNQDQVMVISDNPFEVIKSYEVLKRELKKISGIRDVSALMELPTVAIKDMGQLGIKNNPEKVISTDIQTFDTNTIDFLGIELLAGKNFREDAQKNLPLVKLKSQEDIRDFLVDRPQSYIINERAMKELGWKDPDEALGQEVNWTQGQMVYEYGPIIGVIKNFHQESLKTKIDPVVILNEPHWFRHILVHTSGQNHFEIRKEVEALWGKIFTDAPLNITYLDVEFDKMYTAESKQLQIMKGFTVIALFIAFLGLFGMVAFALKTRTKEIAIRRVLGSDLKELGVLFGKEYLFFALLSTIVAVPIVWNAMNHWLDGYAYRVQIDSFNFIFALLILVFVLLATLAFHVVAKSKQNPVKSLRNE